MRFWASFLDLHLAEHSATSNFLEFGGIFEVFSSNRITFTTCQWLDFTSFLCEFFWWCRFSSWEAATKVHVLGFQKKSGRSRLCCFPSKDCMLEMHGFSDFVHAHFGSLSFFSCFPRLSFTNVCFIEVELCQKASLLWEKRQIVRVYFVLWSCNFVLKINVMIDQNKH